MSYVPVKAKLTLLLIGCFPSDGIDYICSFTYYLSPSQIIVIEYYIRTLPQKYNQDLVILFEIFQAKI
jgi:hypothetical protein